MNYPDYSAWQLLAHERQAELREQFQRPNRSPDSVRSLTVARLSRPPVDRLTTRRWLSWRRRLTLRRAPQT